MRKFQWLKSALLIVTMLLAAACTTERQPVDKSPELALDKRMFEGEFFYKRTVDVVPYAINSTDLLAITGETNKGAIIRWKITKNWLLAYNIHSAVNPVDASESETVEGKPVLAYPIQQHFDILPVENTTTGEAMPVLTTNTDRPWNERRYFLVDMDRDYIQDMELTGQWFNYAFGSYISRALPGGYWNMEFYAHDGSYLEPKDYAEVAQDDQMKQVEWFQFYNREYVQVDYWNAGSWAEIIDLSVPQPIIYRHVFKKWNRDVYGKREYDREKKDWVFRTGKKDNGYRPLEVPDELFRRFGVFDVEFNGRALEGQKERTDHKLATLYNIAWGKKDGEKISWNFEGNEKEIDFQQKTVLTYSPETPEQFVPIACSIAKDYNYAMLGARYAAMHPGSRAGDFDKWYVKNYKNDFFKKTSNGTTVRNERWWYLGENEKLPADWRSKCFFDDRKARIQNWHGDLIEKDEFINDIVVFVKNPVEAYLPTRDGKHLAGLSEKGEDRENGVEICVKAGEVEENGELPDEGKMVYYYDWKSSEGECEEGYLKAMAACLLDEDRRCMSADAGSLRLRHKYMNGTADAQLFNYVKNPKGLGLLGYGPNTVNPETGQVIAGAANYEGGNMFQFLELTIDYARMALFSDDPENPFALDWKKFLKPSYDGKGPEIVFDNNPDEYKPRNVAAPSRTEKEELGGESLLEKFREVQEKYRLPEQRLDMRKLMQSDEYKFRMIPQFAKRDIMPRLNPEDTQFPFNSEEEIFFLQYYNIPTTDFIDAMNKAEEDMNARYDFADDYVDSVTLKYLRQKYDKFVKKYGEKDLLNQRDEFIDEIRREYLAIWFKATEAHEFGHVFGMRHNFSSSVDVENFKDEFYAPENYPAYQANIKKLIENETAGLSGDRKEEALARVGRKVYDLKRGLKVNSGGEEIQLFSDMNTFAWTSIMDYTSDQYIGAHGLGKFDNSAIKAWYGRSVETYETDEKGFVLNAEENGIRDPRYPKPSLINSKYIGDDGKLIYVKPKELIVDPETGRKRLVDSVKTIGGHPIADKTTEKYTRKPDAPLLVDGRTRGYLFYSDEKKLDKPFNNPHDQGYNAREIVRHMITSSDARYARGYFRRGRTQFGPVRQPTGWYMRAKTGAYYSWIHFGLDLQYHLLDWVEKVPLIGGHCLSEFRELPMDKVILDDEGRAVETIRMANKDCSDYKMAAKGIEYWINEKGEVETLNPLGPADYLVAAMEGVNGLIFDVIYRPQVSAYEPVKEGARFIDDPVMAGKVDMASGQERYWIDSKQWYDHEDFNEAVSSVEYYKLMPHDGARYHKDHYDIQDDQTIYKEKLMIRGFTDDKIAAIYALSNTGWPSREYSRDSVAISLHGLSEGVKNAVFAVLSDMANEDSMLTFSPYCIKKVGEKRELVNVKNSLPVNTLFRFNSSIPFYDEDTPSRSTRALRMGSDFKNNLCALAMENDGSGAVYEPVHAGWIYFDKMWPLFHGMNNFANMSADMIVYQQFMSLEIPYAERERYGEPDVEEAEFEGNLRVYRAKIGRATMEVEDVVALDKWKACRKGKDAETVEELCLGTEEGVTIKGVKTRDDYRNYLFKKYARFNPAYRLVSDAGNVKNKVIATSDNTEGSASSRKLNYMETTLSQINRFGSFWEVFYNEIYYRY